MNTAYNDQAKTASGNRQDGVETNNPLYKDRYIILGIILTGILMSVVDGNVVGIALPTITQDFHVSLALSQWAATAYLLTITSTLLIFGKLSEYTGKSKMYIGGIVIFTMGSLACGLASGIYELIGFRILQAIGGAMISGIGAAILYLVFPPAERGRAMGYIGAISGVGCIVGPVLGGFLVDHFGWGSVFLINVPIGIIVIVSALKYLKVNETRSDKLSLDWPGAISLIVSASSLMLLLDQLGSGLAITAPVLTYVAAFALGLVAFVLLELRSKSPLIDLSIFREAKFTLPLISLFISFIVSLLIGIISPFYLEAALHYSPSFVGLVMFVPPAIMVVGAPLSGWLVDKRPWKHYSAGGMVIMSVSFMLLGYFVLRLDLALILLALAIYGVGNALFISPNNIEVMGALPRQKTSIASSTSALVRNLGMALGVSLGSLFMTLQLSATGNIFGMAPSQVAAAMSPAIYFAALLCAVGAIASWLQYVNVRKPGADGIRASPD
jgi:EmrB/QacA subfamily drug resistance transporter